MKDLSVYEGDGAEQNGDSGDPWASLVSGLPGFAAKAKPKNRPSNTAGAAEYHALLWTLFEAGESVGRLLLLWSLLRGKGL